MVTNKSVVRRVTPEDEYYTWLCDMVGVNQEDNSYWLLLNTIHRRTFNFSVPNDDNRAADGLELREQFLSEHTYGINELNMGPCTMLEMLIGLATRCEYIMDSKSMAEWFWIMLDNADLSRFTDDRFVDLDGLPAINHRLDRIVDRTYHKTGVGGLFPLHHHKKDSMLSRSIGCIVSLLQ